MISNINFINIREILSRLTRHPLMTDINLETVIQYTIDFIGIMGLPNIYLDKVVNLTIENYRAQLPCDLISVNQVRLSQNGSCIRSMTDNFNMHNIYDDSRNTGEPTFKTQGTIIYTSFKDGSIQLSYKAIPIDEEGLPLIPDNPIFLETLELYIKKKWFTILFDMGKIQPAVLNNTQQEYAFKAGQCNNEFIIPSPSEMETLTNVWSQLIPRVNEFKKGFRHLGNKEYIKVQ